MVGVRKKKQASSALQMIGISIELQCTPLQFTTEPPNWWFLDVFPFPMRHFQDPTHFKAINRIEIETQEVMMHSCSFDPGLVQVPLEGNESLVLVRVSWLSTGAGRDLQTASKKI